MKFKAVLNETYWRSNISKNKNGKAQGARNWDPTTYGKDFFKVDGRIIDMDKAVSILRKRLVGVGISDAKTWSNPHGIYKKAKELGLT